MAGPLANFQPTPKQGRRLRKLKGNFTAVCHARLNRNNNAQFRLIVSLVRYYQSLAGSDTAGHRNQSAVSIDQDRVGFFVKWIAPPACGRRRTPEHGRRHAASRGDQRKGSWRYCCPCAWRGTILPAAGSRRFYAQTSFCDAMAGRSCQE